MSNHSLMTVCEGQPVVLRAGWDVQLNYFFLNIQELSKLDSDEYIYNQLDDPRLSQAVREKKFDYLDVRDYLQGKARRLIPDLPDWLWSMLYNDMEEGVSGTFYHKADGTLVSETDFFI